MWNVEFSIAEAAEDRLPSQGFASEGAEACSNVPLQIRQESPIYRCRLGLERSSATFHVSLGDFTAKWVEPSAFARIYFAF